MIRLVYGGQANHQGGNVVHRREPGWSPILMGVLMVLSNSVLLVEIIWPQIVNLFSIPLTAGWRWLGLGICVAMDLLFWRVHQTLGKNWAVGVLVKENHHLITDGPYRWVRHPMYTTLFCFIIGFLFLSANLLVGLLWLALTIASAWRFDQEERILTDTFGSEYE
jgi:protein-S-isoprenylcysteine O-methyltransferase Ste14